MNKHVDDLKNLSCIGNDVFLDKQILIRSYIFNVVINLLTYGLALYFPAKENVLFYDFILGVLFTYFIDILFIQKNFKDFGTNTFKKVKYTDIMYRLRYMFRFRIVIKYIVVIIISSIVLTSVRKYVYRGMKRYKIFNDLVQDDKVNEKRHFYVYMMLNLIIKFGLTVLFLNFIKFRWAYIDNDDIYLTTIIITLLTLSILTSSK